MVSTAPTIEPLARTDPCTPCRILEPTLLALILLPTLKTYAHLQKWSGRPYPFQNGHQPSAESAVCMIAVDLIRGAFLELSYDIVKVAVVRLEFFRRRVKGAFNP